MSIVMAGTVAMDDIKTPYGEKIGALGGSASHFSTAASMIAPTSIIGIVGKDYPKKYLNYLQKKGIDTSGIVRSESEDSFYWKGFYENDMNVAHTKDTFLGVLESFNPELTEDQADADFLFLGNIDPDIQWKVYSQVKNPVFSAMDTMNFWIDSKNSALWKIIKKVDALFINDAELRQLSGEVNLIKAANKIRKKGPKMVIVKKGEHGVLINGEIDSKSGTENFLFFAPAYPTMTVKDPTGAGDSFAGGFMAYLYSRYHQKKKKSISLDDIKHASVWATATASISVEGFSTSRFDKTTAADILERCRVLYSYSRFEQLPDIS